MIRRCFAALPFALCAFLISAPLHGQVRPRLPRDTTAARDTTVARDTAAAPDSLRARSDTAAVRDTVRPLPRFSEVLPPAGPDIAFTTFVWDRDALLLEGAVTVADLLERVPGVTGVRAGLYLQPEAVSALGQTRGRIEIVLDGYVLDPLVSSTLDLAHIEVIQLTAVRVERRLDVTRVHLSTAEAAETRPYSRVEAGTGEPDGSVFRGLFIAPRVIAGPLALAIDRVDSDGSLRSEPADALALWGKWSWLAPDSARGIQLEFRQNRLRRQANVPWVADRTRRDVILRGRQRLGPGLGVELFAGHGNLRETVPAEGADSAAVELEHGHWQVGGRGSLLREDYWLEAALRFRDSDALATRQLDVSGGFRPFRLLTVGGSVTAAGWRDAGNTTAWNARAELQPIAPLRLFAELAGGERGAPLYADTAGVSTLESQVVEERSAQRMGANVRVLGVDASAAWIRLDADAAGPFGLPFDSILPAQPARSAQGFEVFGRAAVLPRLFSVYGTFSAWDEAPGWLYLPTRSWRAGLELHTLPLASRNLEILGRVESERRGPMRVPDVAPLEGGIPALVTMPAKHMVNAYLQIRVIDVRAYVRWDDILAARREDLPGRSISGRRIFYGVKWQLFD